MIGLVTELARQQQAAAQQAEQGAALKGQHYREVENEDGTTRLVPARLGTSPLHAAHDNDGESQVEETTDEKGRKRPASASKGMMSVGPQSAQVTQGGGAIQQALAGHVYAAQRNALMPGALADLQTTAAQMCTGPAFAPGTATVQQQNFRAPTNAFTPAHAPGQVPFHTAPINTGGQR
ncbi:hypothetical protein ABZX95_06210 [Streptomyces sp. NPDC004232]|uniref:hypothetical protein n=1 Tax=Streptomyces sp. NPDC004232 TaxID=3154454 RepID=UPI0033A34858